LTWNFQSPENPTCLVAFFSCPLFYSPDCQRSVKTVFEEKPPAGGFAPKDPTLDNQTEAFGGRARPVYLLGFLSVGRLRPRAPAHPRKGVRLIFPLERR